MKRAIHPDYRPVVFQDRATGDTLLTRSTVSSDRTITWTDGNTYPLVVVDESAWSHPYWTGEGRVLDTAGRVEKFNQRYGRSARR